MLGVAATFSLRRPTSAVPEAPRPTGPTGNVRTLRAADVCTYTGPILMPYELCTCGKQVKVNGVRLELGEVEASLLRCQPLALHAAALLIKGRLIAIVQPRSARCAEPNRDVPSADIPSTDAPSAGAPSADAPSGDAPTMDARLADASSAGVPSVDDAGDAPSSLLNATAVALLSLHMRRELPATACPSEIIMLRRLPLTLTGKLDRIALASYLEARERADGADGVISWPSATRTPDGADAHAPPLGRLEQAIATVWHQVLGVSHLHRRSNFMRLGGDSIRALQVTPPHCTHMHVRNEMSRDEHVSFWLRGAAGQPQAGHAAASPGASASRLEGSGHSG